MTDQKLPVAANLDDQGAAGCPACGVGPEQTQVHAQRNSVPYGGAGNTVSVILPLHTCIACQFQWTDESGSVIRDFAVREALQRGEVELSSGAPAGALAHCALPIPLLSQTRLTFEQQLANGAAPGEP